MCNLLDTRFAKLIYLVALFSIPGFVMGQVSVGNWNFNNTLAGTPGSNNTVSAAALSSSIPTGAFNGGTVYFGEGGWPTSPTINTSMYIEFSLTPNAGYTLNLSSLDLTLRRSTTGSPAGAGPRAWALRSSLDGYAADITARTLTTSATMVSVPLGGIYNNLSSTITFRLYGYNAFNNPGGLNRFVFENITARGLMILPVKISPLSGSIQNNIATIQCSIIEAGNMESLRLERSSDGRNFETIAANVSTQNGTYSFSDNLTTSGSKWYYRVKATEKNGSITYSNVIVLQKQQEAGLTLKSIVSSGSQVIAQINADATGTAKLMITTMNGNIIYQQPVTLSKGTQVYTINSTQQPNGMNVLSIVQNGNIISKQFVR